MVACPYCRHKISDHAERCPNPKCASAFPWSTRLRELETRLTSLENQRKATTTLEHDPLADNRPDTAPKAAPPKQSFFEHIRRRALGILVSVGGTLILALQTYILHQQTGLITKQTEALQLDQSAHLREHIVATSEEEANVKRLLSTLGAVANTEIKGLGPADIVKVTNFSVDACPSPQCAKASLDQALKALSDDNPHVQSDTSVGLLRLAAFLAQMDKTFTSGLEAPKEIDMDKKDDKLAALRILSTSGVTQCFFDPGKARDLSEGMARLRLVTSNAFFIQLAVGDPDKYQEMVSKFPQVGGNTKMGMIQMQAATEDLMRVSGAGSATANGARMTYTFEEFVPVFAKHSQDVIAGLRELDNQCNATISQDAAALKSMAVSSER
jgi:hypothetical protein